MARSAGSTTRATPNIVVIDRDGRVAYMGAIDDARPTRLADVKTAKNYIVVAPRDRRGQVGHRPRLRL
jgi:hypothetical protein